MPTVDQKELKYETFRRAARAITLQRYVARAQAGTIKANALGMRLTAIDSAALTAVTTQWVQPDFRWLDIHRQMRSYRRRFELAVWVGSDLEGLCIGKPSHGPDNLTLWFLERRPGATRLKGYIAAVAFDTAEAYAQAIQRRRIKLKDPWPGPLPTYMRLGFTLAETYRGVTYYEKAVP